MEIVTIGTDVGWAGRIGRVLAGILGLAWLVVHIPLWPQADWMAAVQILLFFAIIVATYSILHLFMGVWKWARRPWLASMLLLGPFYLLLLLQIGPLALQQALGLYVSISFIINGAIAYGGCEVIAMQTMVTGVRHVAYCPWNAVDAVERAASQRDHGSSSWTKLHVIVAGLIVGYFVVWDLGGLALLVGVNFMFSDDFGWVLLWPASYFLLLAWRLTGKDIVRYSGSARNYAIGALALMAMAPALAFGSAEIVWMVVMTAGAIYSLFPAGPHWNDHLQTEASP